MEQSVIDDLSRRYEKLYVPAVADTLDKHGFRNQCLAPDIVPLRLDQKVAGPASTAQGHPTIEMDPGIGSHILEGLTPGCIAVWDTTGDRVTGQWGELMSTRAKALGCRGAIVDGGIRDTNYILEAEFSVWSKFRSPVDALGRWKLIASNIPVMISGVLITPGDFIFADADGVIVIPQSIVEEVLEESEAIVAEEDKIRIAVRNGEPLFELYNGPSPLRPTP